MDQEDIFDVFGGYDSMYLYPKASQRAVEQCSNNGYQSYVDFQRTFLSDKAIGVRCQNPKNINDFNLNINSTTNQTVIPSIAINK
jgi:hypothetical protein